MTPRASELLVLIPLACYAVASALYLRQGQPGLALTYAAYSVANVGLIWAAMRSAR